MAYSDFQGIDAYDSKHAGAAVEIQLLDDDDPTTPIIGAATNHSIDNRFENVAIEEAGNEGVDEHAQGRHDVRGSISAFWTPRWNDTLPTRTSFVGKTYTILEVIASDRQGAGNVVNALIGCRIESFSQSHGARGAKTVNLSYVATHHYNGAEWGAFGGA